MTKPHVSDPPVRHTLLRPSLPGGQFTLQHRYGIPHVDCMRVSKLHLSYHGQRACEAVEVQMRYRCTRRHVKRESGEQYALFVRLDHFGQSPLAHPVHMMEEIDVQLSRAQRKDVPDSLPWDYEQMVSGAGGAVNEANRAVVPAQDTGENRRAGLVSDARSGGVGVGNSFNHARECAREAISLPASGQPGASQAAGAQFQLRAPQGLDARTMIVVAHSAMV